MKWKKYKKGDEFSYSLGAFPTMELIEKQPNLVEEIIISPKYKEKEALIQRLERKYISYRLSDTDINRLADKGNIFVIGVFKKKLEEAASDNHVVCHEVSDMGNLGNICRTMLAMGLKNLITIGNCCDLYHPKSVRASMGALFHIKHSHFENLESYTKQFQNHHCYLFMLTASSTKLPQIKSEEPFSLVFGNEGSGLPDSVASYGTPVIIPQSEEVDSLNLTTAVAIGLYHFMNSSL